MDQFNSFEDLTDDDKIDITQGELLEDMKFNNKGWDIIYEKLRQSKEEAEDLTTLVTKDLSAEDVKVEVRVRQFKINFFTEIEDFIEERIERKNTLSSALLPNDNEGEV